MSWDRQNLFVISGIYSGVCYSGVCFHIFYYNSARLSNVVRYNGVPLYLQCEIPTLLTIVHSTYNTTPIVLTSNVRYLHY